MLHLLAAAALVAHIVTPAEDTAQARREALMNKLRTGGYTVMLRHARTDYSVQEPQGTVPAERSAQRNLSDDGIRDAALMGVVSAPYSASSCTGLLLASSAGGTYWRSRVRMILSISRLRRRSAAWVAAIQVLPVPAGPRTMT